jgi:hypothetical protein
MSNDLPADFFIPDDDYDTATADGGSAKPTRDVQAGGQSGDKVNDVKAADDKGQAEPILSPSVMQAINDQVSRAIAAALQAASKK